MIPYYGLPITPEVAAYQAVRAGHAFVSFAHPGQLSVAVELCQSFALDNGAFPAWRSGEPITDWRPFYAWAGPILRFPSCDFAVIPDVIDGSEADNDALVAEWPFGRHRGAPVWHLHESFDRLGRLASEWPRVCLGSSGEFSRVGSPEWHARMAIAMAVICDVDGVPITRLHGLRMLDTRVFSRYPFASADSTTIGRNIGIDKNWTGTFQPTGVSDAKKSVRAAILRARVEAFNSPERWKP